MINFSEHLEVFKEETSIAQLTDQIRRLSAEDAEFKSSFDDPQLLDEKTSSEASRFITEDKVLISEANKEKALANVSTTFNSASPVSDYLKTFEAQAKTGNGVAAKRETFDFDYDSSNPRDRIHLTERLASDARSDVSGEAKTNEINKVVLDAVKLDDTYFTRSSYVIGHLPIAPMNYEIRRPEKVSPEALAPRDEASVHRSRLKQSTYDSSVDALINTSETKYNNYKIDLTQSPKTPESFKSFDSGETMGPDSITSSLAVSPKTPLRSSSRDFILADKSVGSSVSSDSKTLTMRSVESEAVAPKRQVETPGDKSITPSTDSLAQPKSVEPPCSSTESFCSPTKAKSEKSFSSDLQSPVSANSIKFTSGYNYKNDGIDLHKDPTEIGAITSPFYPISIPNKKTPSPYNEDKSKTNRDNRESNEFRGISQDLVVNNYLESKTYAQAFDVESKMSTQAFDVPQLKTTDESSTRVAVDDETFKSLPKNLYNYDYEDVTSTKDNIFSGKDMGRTSAFEPYRKTKFEEELQETDTLSPLPRNLFNEHRNDLFERTRGRSLDGKLETLEITGMSYERSNSTIEKRFPEMLLSPSMEDFANSVKKRSSDVLEDLRHLESKSTEDGEIDPNMLTRKTSFIWEDLKSLEARRQDTFSDSVQGFSRQRIEVPGISISTEGRKTYVVEPKINIENSDSILKVVSYKNSNGSNHDEEDDADDSKLGVWTKVKPRKRNDNGRRSSDRALKIIQENSAILQKILTCQARKRLPDLEEISKEITISPINEEISKIFSPILEKMGLNEHEINEELARINFKELDRNTTTTTASEFEAKINDELSKLSLIGDNEEVAYLPDVDDLTSDYLVAREAFIDRQINEELSKLLVNYSEDSPMSLQKNSSSLDASDDLSGRTAKSYSYKSSDDSLEIKNDLGLKDPMHAMIFKGTSHAYVPRDNYPKSRDLSAKSDVDIYRELEKLDHISYAQALPSVTAELPQDMAPATISYVNDMIKSPKREYPTSVIDKQPTYDISPLKSPYDSPYSSSTALQSSYDYKSRISPRKVPSNPYSVRSYDTKNPLETGFENTTFELTSRKATTAPASLNYDLSKEHLEFRVKYNLDDDYSMNNKSKAQDIDLKLSPFQSDIAELDKDASYFSSKKALTPTNKYSSNKDDNASLASTFETSSYESTYRRKYNNVSPADKYSAFSDNYEALHQPYKVSSLNTDAEVSSYLSGSPASIAKRHRDARVLSPHYQYDYSKPLSSPYATVSPSFDTSLSLTTRGKTTYSDVSPTNTLSYRKSTLAVSNAEENKDTRYGFDKSPSPKSMGFSPFPVRNLPRKPKEVAVKLGLYSPTNSTSSK